VLRKNNKIKWVVVGDYIRSWKPFIEEINKETI
jgi:hypothetical protein